MMILAVRVSLIQRQKGNRWKIATFWPMNIKRLDNLLASLAKAELDVVVSRSSRQSSKLRMPVELLVTT